MALPRLTLPRLTLPRLGIAGRIALIVVAALVLAQMLMAAVYFLERRRAVEGATFAPLIGQVAALAEVLGRVPPADRPLVLRAASGSGLVARIVPAPPQDLVTGPLLRAVARRLRVLMGGPQDRYVALAFASGERHGPMRRLRDLSDARLRAVVALDGGDYLDLTVTGDLALRVFGLPAGFFAGILGFLVALVALLAVRRETRPLSDLAFAVERFGMALEPQAVRERGAPDVRAVIRAVNAMQARIADLVRTRTLVLGAISHDLRTYLTRLRLRLELMPEGPHQAKAVEDLAAMQALLDDALAYARASFSGASAETVDFARVVRAEAEVRLAQGAPVTFAGAEAPVLVRGSASALARVVANLIGNALAYGGRADLTLNAGGAAAELLVEDRGPGIPEAEWESVFEPFYRLEPSRNREKGGAGLGLTIVRQIVEGHGGTVTIADRPGGGARLTVRLPLAGDASA